MEADKLVKRVTSSQVNSNVNNADKFSFLFSNVNVLTPNKLELKTRLQEYTAKACDCLST